VKKFLFLLLLIPILSFAGETAPEEAFLAYGVGVFNDAKYFTGQNKYFEAGYRSFLYNGIYWQYKGGYWGEGSPDQTRKSGFFASSGPGLEIDLQPLEVRSGYGIAMISTPDSQLGGVFPQFQGELYIGLRDSKGDGMGLEYNHISSAGIVTPNAGRDFVVLQLSQKW